MGMCFVATKEEDGDAEAKEIADAFMSKEMNITDPSFREVCNDEIKKKLRAVLKNQNDKLVSTYRKSLADCKL
jgi:hypothetical protein